MLIKRACLTVAFLAIIILTTFSCGRSEESAGQQGLSGSIQVDGSSTVFPVTEAVAEEFRREHSGVRVTIGVSGTGGGFKKFARGEIDISDASRPIKSSEIEAARQNKVDFIELPVAYDGLAVVVNPKNTWCSSITVQELKRLWEPAAQGKVKRWNQIRSDWSDREILLFGPGVDSGTYDYFTEAIVGKEGASRGDFTSSEDDNILVQGVAQDEKALGFFGYAYYEENRDKLKLVSVDDGKPDNGQGPILPSPQTVSNGTYQPLSRPLFIYVRKEAAQRPEVAAFVQFYLENAAALVREVGYIELPQKAYQLALERFQNKIAGSVFAGAGSQVGISVEQLLQKEQKETAK